MKHQRERERDLQSIQHKAMTKEKVQQTSTEHDSPVDKKLRMSTHAITELKFWKPLGVKSEFLQILIQCYSASYEIVVRLSIS